MRNLILILSIILLSSSLHAATFTLQSFSFEDWEKMNVMFTCDGKDISPELHWKNPPKNTASFVLIVSDPDATRGIFYHWVLFNISKSATNLPENVSSLPEGTITALNSFEKPLYNGPCPPKGSSEHRYIFNLYALNSKLKLQEDVNAENIMDAMKNHILDVAELNAKFGR